MPLQLHSEMAQVEFSYIKLDVVAQKRVFQIAVLVPLEPVWVVMLLLCAQVGVIMNVFKQFHVNVYT